MTRKCFLYSILFIPFSFLAYNYAPAQALKLFSDSCCLSYSKPMMIKKGEKVAVTCDTAYLINAYRYRLYEKARTYLVTLAGNTDKMALHHEENSLNRLDSYFTEIQSRYFILSEEVKKSGSANLALLEKVNKELNLSREELSAAKKELEEVGMQLKHSGKKNKTERLIYGTVGAAAGLLLGAVLIR